MTVSSGRPRQSLPAALDQAMAEYTQCQEGIAKYDDHLFRIRSWNIALSALLLAGFFGINVDESPRAGVPTAFLVTPSIAVIVYTLAATGFWLLDSMHKSLQLVYIYNSRAVEEYINGYRQLYIGPSIALRFRRKSHLHLIEMIKNMTDGSVWMFYIPPIVLFGLAVLMTNKFPRLCFERGCGDPPPISRIAAIGLLAILVAVVAQSLLWRQRVDDRIPWCKYWFRPDAKRKREALLALRRAKCHGGEVIGPFKADTAMGRKLGFIDGPALCDDEGYQTMRAALLKQHRLTAVTLEWQEKTRFSWLFGRRIDAKKLSLFIDQFKKTE